MVDNLKKIIRVVAAIIVDNDKYFAAERGYGEWKGYWEFPGGKIEPHETPEETLRREIKEELEVDIKVGRKICTVEYNYPDFRLNMDCFLAEIEKGKILLKEHEAAKWLTKDELDNIEWLPADKMIIEELKNE